MPHARDALVAAPRFVFCPVASQVAARSSLSHLHVPAASCLLGPRSTVNASPTPPRHPARPRPARAPLSAPTPQCSPHPPPARRLRLPSCLGSAPPRPGRRPAASYPLSVSPARAPAPPRRRRRYSCICGNANTPVSCTRTPLLLQCYAQRTLLRRTCLLFPQPWRGSHARRVQCVRGAEEGGTGMTWLRVRHRRSAILLHLLLVHVVTDRPKERR